ncbi:hypothetical protein [Weissella koreensis]|uniref:Uncharacterized protein n=1 Tax=Weissella koreensis TaxID=165096 RepID=A0A7H1MND7_9LACO|nr:hypothetical protein [Weissella koreensis]AVH75771.1 hypothetical protein C4597_07090 [Weissella koreensis]QGN20992.1 hypothetical protein GKC51_07070 [Weissella koreensis]QNT64973.1 hypothetical protein FY536_06805 [Weissella koreensis]
MNLSQLKASTLSMPEQYQLMVRNHDVVLPAISLEIDQKQIKIKAQMEGQLILMDLRNLIGWDQSNLIFEVDQKKHSVFGYRVDGMQLILG